MPVLKCLATSAAEIPAAMPEFGGHRLGRGLAITPCGQEIAMLNPFEEAIPPGARLSYRHLANGQAVVSSWGTD